MKDLQLERSRNKEVLPGKKVDYCVTTLLWGGVAEVYQAGYRMCADQVRPD